MKISLQWLADYIDIKDYFAKPDQLGSLLTSAGLEVEGMQNLAQPYDHVVVGHILDKKKHPDADRLTVCQVSTGEGVVHQIVCGAKNHNEGDRVVVALPGAVLPGNFKITRSQIRGVDSGGMLCSEKELGLKDESEGILLLPATAPVGQPFAVYQGLDDILFELKVTPNRADCLSHFGLAREIGTLLGREAKLPAMTLVEVGGVSQEWMKVELHDAAMCPRYSGRGVSGVQIGDSPPWLKKRLGSIGLKSINNVVDVTNFVMMELGQPLHAFDTNKVDQMKIIVEPAKAGERFVTLDGSELVLDGSELTIRDLTRTLALAGIIGGKNSGIAPETKNIFIESAYFAPGAVRKTARKFGLETDSSYRFARGTNPEMVLLALQRAAHLIQQVAGGEMIGEIIDLYPKPLKREPIEISIQMVEDRLGSAVKADSFTLLMKRLGCSLEAVPSIETSQQFSTSWRVLPPIFRWDLLIDMDLVEEYARLNGYEHIAERLPPLSSMPLPHDLGYTLESKACELLKGEGCLQAVNYGFISGEFQNQVIGRPQNLSHAGLALGEANSEPVAIVNPLNEDLNVMRISLVPGLLKNVEHNSRRGNPFGRLFEIGAVHAKSFRPDGSHTYLQASRLAFAFWGEKQTLWHKPGLRPLPFTLKGVIENLLAGFQIDGCSWESLASQSHALKFLHPGQAASVVFQGKAVGFIGSLHPSLAAQLKIREPVVLAELNLEKLMHGQLRSPSYHAISKMPAIERDLAFQMPTSLPVAEVEAEIRKVGGEFLSDVSIFDIFTSAGLASDQRSVAFRLIFQAPDTTLEDAQINVIRDRVVTALTARFSIALR